MEHRRRSRARTLRDLDLGGFVPALSPELDRPEHLAPVLRVLERAVRGEPVRVLLSTPPQHGKTSVVEAAIARDLLLNPGSFWAYVTYSADKARIESRHIRDLAIRAGVGLRPDTRALGYWRTPQGGGLLATGVGGPITGQRNLKRIVIDDPIKGAEDAESSVVRDATFDWFQSSIMTRAHPDTSIVVVGTRWHHDDLIGRLSAQKTDAKVPIWEVINLPALDDGGVPLWPVRRPAAFLAAQREGMTSYFWNALYMGRPVPRGESVFGAPVYRDTPTTNMRVGGGLDLAYTEKTKSDYSVAVVLARVLGDDPRTDRYYVLDVRRKQQPPPEFHEQSIESIESAWPGIRFRCYLATSEMGSGQFMRKLGTNIDIQRAKVDKFQRAQPVAAAWNAGRVSVPASAPWLGDFLREIQLFTGVDDRHDDQVDALAAAYDLLASQPAEQRRRPRLRLAVPLEQRELGS